MDIVNAYFRRFYPVELDHRDPSQWEFSTMLGGMERYVGPGRERTIFPRMLCADGFSVSVQGHWGAYSSPRDDFAESYSSVELGFPSAADDLIQEHAEEPNSPTETVYGYVPVATVALLIEKHGGLFDWNAADLENSIHGEAA